MEKQKRVWIKAFIITLGVTIFTNIFIVELIRVEGDSMLDTLKDGEILIINKVEYLLSKPKRKDIIVFRYPSDKKTMLIKRVIGLENETFEIKNNKSYINDIEFMEDYIKYDNYEDFQKKAVPNNTVFVLGDNRNNSKDSRFRDVGFIPIRLIAGKATYVVWPIKNFRIIE